MKKAIALASLMFLWLLTACATGDASSSKSATDTILDEIAANIVESDSKPSTGQFPPPPQAPPLDTNASGDSNRAALTLPTTSVTNAVPNTTEVPAYGLRYVSFESMESSNVDMYAHFPALHNYTPWQNFTVTSGGISVTFVNFNQSINLNQNVLQHFLDGLATASQSWVNVTSVDGTTYDLRISKSQSITVMVAPYDIGTSDLMSDEHTLGNYPEQRIQGYSLITGSGILGVVKSDGGNGTNDLILTEACNSFIDLSPNGFYAEDMEIAIYSNTSIVPGDAFCNMYARSSSYTSGGHVTNHQELYSFMSTLTVFGYQYMYLPEQLFGGYITQYVTN